MASVTPVLQREVTWQVGVSHTHPLPDLVFDSLQAAVQAWNRQPAGTVGVIAILDSSTYEENLAGVATIRIPAGSQLLIVAADWPAVTDPEEPGRPVRQLGQVAAQGVRPHVRGQIAVTGAVAREGETPGELIFNGVLIEGSVAVKPGDLGRLRIEHCTLAPGRGELVVESGARAEQKNLHLLVRLDHSICAPVTLPDDVAELHIHDSIVSGGGESAGAGIAINAPGAAVEVQRSTIFGGCDVRSLEASNCIFTGQVTAARRQAGCVRFSYLPPESIAPRRYRCQPDLEIAVQLEQAEKTARSAGTPLLQAQRDAIRAEVQRWLIPSFTAVQYGHPGYAQLRLSCPAQIRAGADDEAEMGAFHDLFQPQRETNLRVRLEEYLRVGLEAGIFYVD
jgi:hypothetical protein